MSDENTNPPSKRETLFSKLLPPLLVFAITAPAAWFLSRYWDHFDGRLRQLSYIVQTSDSILPMDRVGSENIVVTVDGREIENVSTASIAVFNLTDLDYEDVILVVEFETPSQEPIQLLSETGGEELAGVIKRGDNSYSGDPDATGNDRLEQAVENALANIPARAVNSQTRFEYKIEVANRSNQAFFYTDFVFDSTTAPKINLQVVKKGVSLQEYVRDSDSTIGNSPWMLVLASSFVGVLFAAGASFFGLILSFLAQRRIQAPVQVSALHPECDDQEETV